MLYVERTIGSRRPFTLNIMHTKVCLCIVANGEGSLYGEYTSVLLHVMKGEFDAYINWPFQLAISVQLLDQEVGEHTKTLEFTDRTPDDVASRVIVRERAEFGWGLFPFIEHDKLEPQYLKNNLCLQVG